MADRPTPGSPAADTLHPDRLSDVQLDALREVANIGAGHAATALSQMTGKRIMINVPQLATTARREVGRLFSGTGGNVAAVDIRMLGDLTGQTLLVLSEDAARELASSLTGRPGAGTELSELERSAIQEVGNILASAYLNALTGVIGGVLLPTPPHLMVGLCAEVVEEAANRGPGSDPAFTINTRFSMEEGGSVEGTFLVLPDHGSLGRMLQALRLAA